MKRAGKVLTSVAVAFVVLAGGLVAAVSFVSAEGLVHPLRVVPAYTPADAGLPYERVAFAADDGVPLVGWWMPANASKGTVVFLHGYGDSKNQSLKVAPFLHEAGWNVFAFDFRAHGESGGDHTTVGLEETRDVAAAWSWLAARGVDMRHVALLGFSMGAATALNSAASLPGLRAVVADSAFASLDNVAANSITHFTSLPHYPFGPLAVTFAAWIAGEDVRANQPARAAAQLRAPVLVIQGGLDDVAFPDADGRVVYAAAPRGSEWMLVPNAPHVASHTVDPAAYEARVLAFLDRDVAS